MQNNKTIRIFLGSSIVELHDERIVLGDYIMNSVRPIFKNDGIEIELFKCEDIHSGNIGELQQDKIDKLLRNSDVSVFMFKNKAGKQTVREFGVARETQKTKRHEMYVYCFDVPKAEKGEDLNNFQNRLIEEEFYWYPCKNVTDLESQFILGLLKYERELLGKQPAIDIEQESITEKDGDALFEKYEQNEQAHKQTQAPLRKEIHQRITELLQQTKTVMENEDNTIAARIIKMIELYKKADRWAAATAYDKEKYSDLLFDYAQFLYKYGMYKDSETIFLRQIALAEELYGTISEKNAPSYHEIAMVYRELGNYDKALEYHFKALSVFSIIVASLDMGEEIIAKSYDGIGLVYGDKGDYDKELEYHSKALAIREKVLGIEHPYTATSYNNVAGDYYEKGNYVKALEYYFKALAIREKIHGIDHLDAATPNSNIGIVYADQGDYDKALEYYFKALAIREKVLGTKHPDTAASYINIGSVYYAQGDYDKALEYYFKALAILEIVLGTEHKDTATSYNNIGLVYCKQGDYDKAMEYSLKALSIKEEVLGTEHPNTATSYNNIGLLYHEQGDYGKALEYYFKALPIVEKNIGSEHSITATTYYNIGLSYHKQSNYYLALEYHFKALAIREKVLGTEHPDTAKSYNNIGAVYYKQGDYDKALEYINKGYQICLTVLGPEHPYTKDTLLGIKIMQKTAEEKQKSKGKTFWQRLLGI